MSHCGEYRAVCLPHISLPKQKSSHQISESLKIFWQQSDDVTSEYSPEYAKPKVIKQASFYGVKGIISLLVLVLHQLIKSTHYIFIPSWICMSLFKFCAKKSRHTFRMFSFNSYSPIVYIHYIHNSLSLSLSPTNTLLL